MINNIDILKVSLQTDWLPCQFLHLNVYKTIFLQITRWKLLVLTNLANLDSWVLVEGVFGGKAEGGCVGTLGPGHLHSKVKVTVHLLEDGTLELLQVIAGDTSRGDMNSLVDM